MIAEARNTGTRGTCTRVGIPTSPDTLKLIPIESEILRDRRDLSLTRTCLLNLCIQHFKVPGSRDPRTQERQQCTRTQVLGVLDLPRGSDSGNHKLSVLSHH
eukprot:3935516-Rhodomonas_salina.1